METNEKTSIKTIENSEHYIWGENCDGWHLLKTDSLSIIKEKMPAYISEGFHLHKNAQQFFYILKGNATFEIEGEVYEVKENQGIHIKPNQKHRILNNSENNLEFIVVSEPKSYGDRVNLTILP
ncbi:MAG: cupin domain-containing protein [Tannerellaceae bacterium]|nr:cupin domain-containing protein [Tannerellaceae bacterium]